MKNFVLKLIYALPVCLLGHTGIANYDFDTTMSNHNNITYHTKLEDPLDTKSDSLKDKRRTTDKAIALNIKIKNSKKNYLPGQKHTLALELELEGENAMIFNIEPKLPKDWKLISSDKISELSPGKSKIVLLSFFIPANTSPGTEIITLKLTDKSGKHLRSEDFKIVVAENYKLEVFLISNPESVKAGEEIITIFGIRNTGNVPQEIQISSNGLLSEIDMPLVKPDSLITITSSRPTNAKHYYLITLSTYLEITGTNINESIKSYANTTVFPSKIKQRDAFFRFPIRASFNYNSYTAKDIHFSTISAELAGDGYLDEKKQHHLNFLLRAPQQQTLKRFGITDQYSLIYDYKNQTTIYLGDHAYFINRLGFDNRYGMGFRIDQRVKRWIFTAFYSNPRLFSYNDTPLYGVQAKYAVTKKLQLGVSLSESKGTIRGVSNKIDANPDEQGQIATISLDYKSENTHLEAELSGSFTNLYTDYAGFINYSQSYKKFTYSGNLTLTGENYFGSIRNSLQYANNLFYKNKKWNASIGHIVSRVNQRLNPLFYAAEPYYENSYALLGYRFNQKHFVTIRVDQRKREDQLEPKSYFYKEKGITYRYLFSGERFNFSFNGRLAKTRNLLSATSNYRDSYAHSFNASYLIDSGLSIRVGLNHNYNNRYGLSNLSTSYTRYSLGINYSMSKAIRINASYNSGFSPEDTYLRRDFLNANISYKPSKNHLFEIRANYYENAGSVNRRELLAFGKYTYSFGAPIKRILEQGGIDGKLYSIHSDFEGENIKIIAAGQLITSKENGSFRLNNLPLGTNYIFLDHATLPEGFVEAKKAPYEVVVTQNKIAELNIELVKAATVRGKIMKIISRDTLGYKGYIKLNNEDFEYAVESDVAGNFIFKNIVPGNYKIALSNTSKESEYQIPTALNVQVAPGGEEYVDISLKTKDRKIKFKTTNFNLSN